MNAYTHKYIYKITGLTHMDLETFLSNTQCQSTEAGYLWTGLTVFVDRHLDMIKALNEDDLVAFLRRIGLIANMKVCSDCGDILTDLYYRDCSHPFFRCKKRSCKRQRISAVKNTFFEGAKLSYRAMITVLYYFAQRRPVADAAASLEISKPTIIIIYKFLRSGLSYFLDANSEKLGGPGIVVHFDETPMTRRHGMLGRHNRSNTVWVVGAVDIHTKKCFLKFLPSHNREVLFAFLNEWILPGSTVHTDCHASYATLSSLGFQHFQVNHSRNLVGADGIHTNWIEGIFGNMKKMMRKYDAQYTTVSDMELYLAEFCFRYSFGGNERATAFTKLSYILREVYAMSEFDLS